MMRFNSRNMSPVSSARNAMNSAADYAIVGSNHRDAMPRSKAAADDGNIYFPKFGMLVLASSRSSACKGLVVLVLLSGPPNKIAGAVVATDSVQVTTFHAGQLWTLCANEHKVMHLASSLRFALMQTDFGVPASPALLNKRLPQLSSKRLGSTTQSVSLSGPTRLNLSAVGEEGASVVRKTRNIRVRNAIVGQHGRTPKRSDRVRALRWLQPARGSIHYIKDASEARAKLSKSLGFMRVFARPSNGGV